jgi:biopolymer transport protein ExbB
VIREFADIGRLFEYGGVVLVLIFVLAVAVWTLLIERLWFYKRVYPLKKRSVLEAWAKLPDPHSWQAHKIRQMLVSRTIREFNASLPLIKVLTALCPFFGLLGTVTGMIEVFDVMAVLGTTDARAMASGVAKATVPTMAGMLVAVAALLATARYEARLKAEEQSLVSALTR